MATRTLTGLRRPCLAAGQQIAESQPSWKIPEAIFDPDSLLAPQTAAIMQQDVLNSIPPLSVLVVEDDARQAAILEAMIQSQEKKVDITIAENLPEGWKQIKNNSFDLVLCDMELPEKGEGITLIRCTRSHPDSQNHSTKIIAMSSNLHIYQRSCEEVGADQALSKPISVDKIKEWAEKAATHKLIQNLNMMI